MSRGTSSTTTTMRITWLTLLRLLFIVELVILFCTYVGITWLTQLVVFIMELAILFLPIAPVSHSPVPLPPSRAPSRGQYNLEPGPRKLYEY